MSSNQLEKCRPKELREKSKEDLESRLSDLKKELSTLRVAKVTGAASKLVKIRVIRRNISRVLTVINQNIKANVRLVAKEKGCHRLPLDLRYKKTRAIRKGLTPHQKSLKTLKEIRRLSKRPMRKFALKQTVKK